MLRNLADDFKESPATMTLCALWVVVFVAMLGWNWAAGQLHGLDQVLIGTLNGGHLFGDMTVAELGHGEIWRVVTSTFVHYNLMHIGMNLYGMYILGCLVEHWYGPWQLVAIYAVIGGLGNLLSGFIRVKLLTDPLIHSGGGSTVVVGLVALCAVVGWRTKTRTGDYLRGQMVAVLLITAISGVIIPMIDNWGHAGGATIGALIGFAHYRLIRTANRPVARWAGVLGVLVLAASIAAQVRDDRRDAVAVASAIARIKEARQAKQNLDAIAAFYLTAWKRSVFDHLPITPKSLLNRPPATKAGQPDPRAFLIPTDAAFRRDLEKNLKLLDATRDDLGIGPDDESFRRVRLLLGRVFAESMIIGDQREFVTRMTRDQREFLSRMNSLAGLAVKKEQAVQKRFEDF